MENTGIGNQSTSPKVFLGFHQEIHTEELVEENSVDWATKSTVTRAIKISKESRLNIDLEQELLLQINYLEIQLDKIADLSLEYVKAIEDTIKHTSETSQSSTESGVEDFRSSFSFSSDDHEAEERIQKIELDLKEKISKLISSDEINLFKLSENDFSGWWLLRNCSDKQRVLNTSFLKEQLINKCVNFFYFYKKAKIIINEIRPIIFKEFAPSCIDTPEVSFEILVLGEETHKRGKTVLKVTFFLEDKNLFSISYKPREAFNDKRVMKLFDDLNNLSSSEKSMDAQLGVLKIVNYTWKQEEFSLWEFAEGVIHKTVASQTIQNEFLYPKTQDNPQRKRLNNQLCRLESICSYVKLSDLHGDNIVFSKVKNLEDDPQIFAIDLENFQFISGGKTGLFDERPKLIQLKKGELKLLDEFNEETRSISFRFVPLDTGFFLGALSFYFSFEETSRFLIDSIIQLGFKMNIGSDDLKWYILNDYIHNDVPLLTQKQDSLYYWTLSELIHIATKEI